MAKKTTFVCNVCGKEKQQTNHWWIAYVSQAVGYMISPWSDSLADSDQVETLCGQACVIQAVNKFMSDLGGK